MVLQHDRLSLNEAFGRHGRQYNNAIAIPPSGPRNGSRAAGYSAAAFFAGAASFFGSSASP